MIRTLLSAVGLVLALLQVNAHARSPLCDNPETRLYVACPADDAPDSSVIPSVPALSVQESGSSVDNVPTVTEENYLDHLKGDPIYSDLVDGIPPVTEKNYLDHLKDDPNYSHLFKQKPGNSSPSQSPLCDNPETRMFVSCTEQDDMDDTNRLPPVTEENYLDHLKDFPIYKDLLAENGEEDGIDSEAMAERALEAAGSIGSLLSGDQASACEAMLCLAAGNPPHECSAALTRYFAIKMKRAWRTAKARSEFLDLCPVVRDSIIK